MRKKASSTLWKWSRRILVGLAAVLFLLVFVIFPTLMAYFITHSRTRPFELRMTDTPAKYGVPYQDVMFYSYRDLEAYTRASNGVVDTAGAPRISGWYLPNDSAKAVLVYVHGLFRSRQEMLQRACDLWRHGYAGLIIDLRRHGTSTGEMTSMGYLERLDVLAAVRYVKENLGLQLPVIACSVSMGAAAALLAAADSELLDGVIAESSFLSFDNTIAHHVRLLLDLPKFPFADLISLITKIWVGFRGKDFDLRRAAGRLGERPALFIADENDTRMPLEVERQLFAAAKGKNKEFVVMPDATHGAAYRTHPERYIESITDFLSRHFHRMRREG